MFVFTDINSKGSLWCGSVRGLLGGQSINSGLPCPSSVILVNYFTSLCLTFLVSKMGIICHRVVGKIRKFNIKYVRNITTNTALQSSPGTE